MKKINNKGFTLVELLGVFAILSVIMLVAIPNVMGILDKNKKNTYVQNAKQMIALAEYKLKSDTSIHKPTNGETVIITLGCLDTQDIETGPEGWPYNKDQSFVAVNINGEGIYTYYVSLKEEKPGTNGSTYRGIPLISRTELNSENAINNVSNNFGNYSKGDISTYLGGTTIVGCGSFPEV